MSIGALYKRALEVAADGHHCPPIRTRYVPAGTDDSCSANAPNKFVVADATCVSLSFENTATGTPPRFVPDGDADTCPDNINDPVSQPVNNDTTITNETDNTPTRPNRPTPNPPPTTPPTLTAPQTTNAYHPTQ